MINIVIPMAGAGSRFAKEGYKDPKPLIQIHGTPMIKVIIGNLRPKVEHQFIFICQRKHVIDFGLRAKLQNWSPGCQLVEIDGLTEGAACTVLAAKTLINSDQQLMIANSDQYVDININNYLSAASNPEVSGLIMTMKASDPKWSFVGLDEERMVKRVVEKQVISDEATVGIYNFSKGSDFVRSAEAMIASNDRVNGEFYVAPVYNSMIQAGHKIGIYNIGSEGAGMYGLGIPADLENFLKLPVSNKSVLA